MTVVISLSILLLLGLVGYVFYLNKKLINSTNANITMDNNRVVKAEALEDTKIKNARTDREAHAKETDASDLLDELTNSVHARSSN